MFYTRYMTEYNKKCPKCKGILLVPTWKSCEECSKRTRGIYKKKEYNTEWFEHKGFLVKIPLVRYYFAKVLLYDYEEREIIGWQ